MPHDELDAFLDRHWTQLVRYAQYAARGNHDLAHDLLQDALLHLAEGSARIDWGKAPLTYIQLLIQRCVRNYYPPELVILDEPDSILEVTQEGYDEDDERHLILYEWISELGDQDQTILLAYLEGDGPALIARRLGLSRRVVENRVLSVTRTFRLRWQRRQHEDAAPDDREGQDRQQ